MARKWQMHTYIHVHCTAGLAVVNRCQVPLTIHHDLRLQVWSLNTQHEGERVQTPTSTCSMHTHLVIKEVSYNRVSRCLDLMSSTKDPLLEQDAAVRSSSFWWVVLNVELVGKFIVLNFTIYSGENNTCTCRIWDGHGTCTVLCSGLSYQNHVLFWETGQSISYCFQIMQPSWPLSA